jgi:hypothetical protein
LQTPLTNKMLEAQRALRRRFHGGNYPGRKCVVIMDKLRLTSDEDPTGAVAGLPDFHSLGSHFVRPVNPTSFHAYRRVAWFHHKFSGMKICIESEPLKGWLAHYAVTMFADDNMGLRRHHVFSLLEIMPGATLTLIELAFDFCLTTEINREFVRRYATFGKSRRVADQNPVRDRWGSPKGTKMAKSYCKWENASHRVELVFRPRFLRHHKIKDVFDFARFVQLLPKRHLYFARLDTPKLLRALENKGLTEVEHQTVLCRISELESDLCATLRYLRRNVGLKNTQRLLVPLAINNAVRAALERWAAQWPTTPSRLEVGKKG